MANDINGAHPRSTARIGDHPIHPMLIPFPIVCFILTFAADVAYSRTTDAFWATGSRWLLGIGLVQSVASRSSPIIFGHKAWGAAWTGSARTTVRMR